MTTPEPTIAALQAENARLQSDNAKLRDLLEAVREAASAVPVTPGEPLAELERWRDIGIALRVHTRLRDVIDPARQAQCLREAAGEAIGSGPDTATRRLLDDLAALNEGSQS